MLAFPASRQAYPLPLMAGFEPTDLQSLHLRLLQYLLFVALCRHGK